MGANSRRSRRSGIFGTDGTPRLESMKFRTLPADKADTVSDRLNPLGDKVAIRSCLTMFRRAPENAPQAVAFAT
jgi:hypothetical protein